VLPLMVVPPLAIDVQVHLPAAALRRSGDRPMSQSFYEPDLAAAYAELQNLLVDGPEIGDFLHQVAMLAATVVPDASVGITMRRDHEIATVATSDEFAFALDEIQYGRGQGPCLETLHTGQPISVSDLAEDHRWGEYRIHALTYGVRSSLSLPLTIHGDTRGALNLYTKTPNSFGTAEAARGQAFARQAATALMIVLGNADRQALEGQLREALATRALIDQAVGIIMGQQRIDSLKAFAVLRDASQTRNRKLRDIAADLIQTVTGQPPIPPRPFTDPR
jgi:GAF domain-containing protein